MSFWKAFNVIDKVQKRVYIVAGQKLEFLERPAYQVGLRLVSGNLDFRKVPDIP